MTKPIGITTFKPFITQYCISPNEFKELVDKYFKEVIKIDIQTEVRVAPNTIQLSTDKFQGELEFTNIKKVPNEVYHSLMAHQIEEDTDPTRNFEILMNKLFATPEWYDIEPGSESGDYHIFINCLFKDYIKFDGPSAQREAE
jgi:hypothetical protein